MLHLNVFGPYFGMPDASPFCMKGLFLLKISGLPYKVEKMNFRKAPKGKAPYLVDGDKTIADSHFIIRHLEMNYEVDFSGGYNKEELATGWAVARMLEEHLYFLMVNYRWLNDENFRKGPTQFFADAPALLRPLISRVVRNKVRKTQNLQGLGRHSPEEILELAKGDVDAVQILLGEKPFFLGEKACGIDATVCSFLWSSSLSYFKSPLGDYIRSKPLLMAYLQRMATKYFPDYKVG